MAIDFLRDEVDKRAHQGMDATAPQPGMHRRWVRTVGHGAEAHLARMHQLGYRPVQGKQDQITSELLQKKRGRPKQLDTTIRDGTRVLMECPVEEFQKRRREQQALTRRRTEGVAQPLKDMGGFDHTTARTTNREE